MRSTTSLDELSEDLHPSSAAPLSEEEVRGLEDLVQASLPGEFRSFLLRFGLGAHPGLVIDLEWIIEWTSRERQACEGAPWLAVSASDPFPITEADAARLPRLAPPILTSPRPTPGTMLLRDHGSSLVSILALNGDLAGTVWMTDQRWGETYWWPSAPWIHDHRWGYVHCGWTTPIPFLDWYIGWTRPPV
ncbi:hypothetical protein [Nonomuraea sp. NPDC049504]|uniref:hypothetical protein n=1 Tax=Nonomuraea sp. NPDC049504 TaxID=3154729 RepID=UPI00342804EA